MNEIFEKAFEEVASLGTDERTMDRFRSLTGRKWIDEFSSEDFPSFDDNKHLGADRLIDKFVGRNKIIGISDKWLWHSCVSKCAQESLPFTAFSFLIVGDALYTHLEAIDEFYQVEENPNRPYQKFMNGLFTDIEHNYDYFEDLKPCLDNLLEADISEPLKNLVAKLKEAIPEPEPEPEPEQPTPQQGAFPAQSSMAGTQAVPGISKRPEYEQDAFFKVFLLAEQLDTICNVVYTDIKKGKQVSEEQIVGFLQQSQGMPSLRHKFITNLNILYWYLHRGNEKAIFILRSIWELVFQLAARDKKDINLDSPQDIVLAMWEPGLYIALVKRTIEAFEKFGDKCNFTYGGGKKFDKVAVEKLKMHEFAIGYFVQ